MTTRAIFATRISELKTYAVRHGHINVPHAEAPLGPWVGYIRRRKRDGYLTIDEIQAIEQVPGWSWEPRKAGRKKKVELHKLVYDLRYKRRRLSLQEIADVTKLSRQRIHQILKEIT